MRIEMYEELFQKFIEGSLPVKNFEASFLEAFKAMPPGMSAELYTVIEDVFWAVEKYWEECLPGQETADTISEEQLRKEVKEAHLKLGLLEIFKNK